MAFRTKPILLLDKTTFDLTRYRQMIGSLIYLTSSRPNILFSDCYFLRYQANPQESHMKEMKNILRYLWKTTSLELWYPSNYGFFV